MDGFAAGVLIGVYLILCGILGALIYIACTVTPWAIGALGFVVACGLIGAAWARWGK